LRQPASERRRLARGLQMQPGGERSGHDYPQSRSRQASSLDGQRGLSARPRKRDGPLAKPDEAGSTDRCPAQLARRRASAEP
jgi:hypothetical protein